MDIRTIDTSDSRVRQLRDEPQSGRYPTREYQQRQPSLERGAADQTDLKNVTGKSVLRTELRTTWDRSAQLTEDSHINSAAGIPQTRLTGAIHRQDDGDWRGHSDEWSRDRTVPDADRFPEDGAATTASSARRHESVGSPPS